MSLEHNFQTQFLFLYLNLWVACSFVCFQICDMLHVSRLSTDRSNCNESMPSHRNSQWNKRGQQTANKMKPVNEQPMEWKVSINSQWDERCQQTVNGMKPVNKQPIEWKVSTNSQWNERCQQTANRMKCVNKQPIEWNVSTNSQWNEMCQQTEPLCASINCNFKILTSY